MATRTRSRPNLTRSFVQWYPGFLPGPTFVPGFSAIIVESDTGIGTDVEHLSVETFINQNIGVGPSFNTDRFSWTNLHPLAFSSLPAAFREKINDAFSQMVSDLASSNNKFELLTFLAEIDESLLLFTKKFWKNLTYGSLTWGVIPFVSEVRSLVDSLYDLYKGSKQFKPTRLYRRRFVNYNVPWGSGGYALSYGYACFGFVTLNASAFLETPNFDEKFTELYRLLDELGVHPDLKTAWDLLPLSFVVDYFVPIGDLLESLSPRGWSQRVILRGYRSVKGSYSSSESYITRGNPNPDNPNRPYPSSGLNVQWCYPVWDLVNFYKRECLVDVPVEVLSDVKWEAPSLKELFNVGYLAGLSKL